MRTQTRTPVWFFPVVVLLLASACSSPPTPPPGIAPSATRRPILFTTQAPTARAKPTPRPTLEVSRLGVPPDDLAGLEVEFWHVWSGEVGEALTALVDEFSATNEYGLRVRLVNQGGFGDLSRAVSGAIAVGEPPDLAVGFGNQIQSWDRSGMVVDLDPYLQDPDWGYTPAEVRDFYPIFLEADRTEDKRIGLPAQRAASLLFYNLTWGEELGFEAPPRSLEEFTEQACAAAQALRADDEVANDGTGGWVVDTSTTSVLGWVYAFGGEVVTPDGYDFDNPATAEALGYLKDLFDEGCAWLSKNRFPDVDFAARRALLTTSGTAGLPFQERSLEDADNSDAWTPIPFPAEEGEGAIVISGPSFAMFESTPEEQVATWLLIRWLLEPQNQARWIQVSGHLPSRRSALEPLQGYHERHPQWAAILDLLPLGRAEPTRASWSTVRWALSDAAEQIFRLGLSQEQIPALLEQLDTTAAELHAQAR